jgi:hypothetical protein
MGVTAVALLAAIALLLVVALVVHARLNQILVDRYPEFFWSLLGGATISGSREAARLLKRAGGTR